MKGIKRYTPACSGCFAFAFGCALFIPPPHEQNPDKTYEFNLSKSQAKAYIFNLNECQAKAYIFKLSKCQAKAHIFTQSECHAKVHIWLRMRSTLSRQICSFCPGTHLYTTSLLPGTYLYTTSLLPGTYLYTTSLLPRHVPIHKVAFAQARVLLRRQEEFGGYG